MRNSASFVFAKYVCFDGVAKPDVAPGLLEETPYCPGLGTSSVLAAWCPFFLVSIAKLCKNMDLREEFSK